MKVVKIELFYGAKSQGSYIENRKNFNWSICHEFEEGLEDGDSLKISFHEMPKKQYELLQEFEGF